MFVKIYTRGDSDAPTEAYVEFAGDIFGWIAFGDDEPIPIHFVAALVRDARMKQEAERPPPAVPQREIHQNQEIAEHHPAFKKEDDQMPRDERGHPVTKDPLPGMDLD